MWSLHICSQGLEILTLIRENQKKRKKYIYHLFYIKGFGRFIFNPFKLIWI
jgi:hypothetical protein